MRHSRRVRLLRRAIPIGCVAVVAVIMLASWLRPLQVLAALPASVGSVLISGSKIKMEAPRLAGFTRDARPYELSAKSAAQDIKSPDLVELQDIEAKIDMADRGLLNLVARGGLYDSKKDRLTLTTDIIVKSPSYEGYMQEAVIEIKGGKVVSNKPVEIKMMQGTLNAKTMEISESGQVVRFDGGVNLNLQAGALQGEQKAAGP